MNNKNNNQKNKNEESKFKSLLKNFKNFFSKDKNINNQNTKENNNNENNNINNQNNNSNNNPNNNEEDKLDDNKNEEEIFPFPFDDSIPNKTENEIPFNDEDFKKIEAIIAKCEKLFNFSKTQFSSFDIREAISTLIKVVNTLDSVKKTINNDKMYCLPLLSSINSLREKSFNNLQEYRIMIYKIIPFIYKPIPYKPALTNQVGLIEFCKDIFMRNHLYLLMIYLKVVQLMKHKKLNILLKIIF